jgi:hypothetical protein
MLFHVSWEWIDSSEDGQKRVFQLFSQWEQGPAEFQSFYGWADRPGVVSIIKADNATVLAKTLVPWTPWLMFTTHPILPVQESAEISGEAAAWRDAH